jgi:hypothetical protein
MKKFLFFSLVFLFMMSDSHSAMLCRDSTITTITSRCPIVTNILSQGGSYSVGSYNVFTCISAWSVTGSWGIGRASMTINGNAKCHAKGGTTKFELTSGDLDECSYSSVPYCWCQILDSNSIPCKWVFLEKVSDDVCGEACGERCALMMLNGSGFRSAICLGACS